MSTARYVTPPSLVVCQPSTLNGPTGCAGGDFKQGPHPKQGKIKKNVTGPRRFILLFTSHRTPSLSGSPTQLNKEARPWRVRSKRLFDAASTMICRDWIPLRLNALQGRKNIPSPFALPFQN